MFLQFHAAHVDTVDLAEVKMALAAGDTEHIHCLVEIARDVQRIGKGVR
jgi:hypothetical protein